MKWTVASPDEPRFSTLIDSWMPAVYGGLAWLARRLGRWFENRSSFARGATSVLWQNHGLETRATLASAIVGQSR